MLARLQLPKNKLAILYKLLFDLLFILLIFFTLALIAEGLLPGIIASHFGISKVALVILLDILAIYVLSRQIEISSDEKINKKAIFALLFISAALIFNSLLKLNIFLNLFILIAVITIGYYIQKIIIEE